MYPHLASLKAERKALLAKPVEEWSSIDAERAKALPAEIEAAETARAKADAATSRLRAAGMGVPYEGPREDDEDDETTHLHATKNAGIPTPTPRASNFARFTAATAKAFKAADGVVGGTSKALVPSGSVTLDYTATPVTEPRPSMFVQSALPTLPVEAPSGAFLRQSGRTNAAAPVALGADKPESDYAFDSATWGVSTVAHLSKPVERAWVQDFAGLVPALSTELAYGLAVALDKLILNGGVDEQGTERKGLLTDTGIDTTAFETDALKTIRYSLSELEEDGVTPTAFVLHPRDWRDLDLLREDTTGGKFLFGGAPTDAPQRQIWGVPVILSTEITQGTALAGDFANGAALAVREGATVTWAEQGTYQDGENTRDLFGSNRLRFRCEGRFGLIIAQPLSFRKIALTA